MGEIIAEIKPKDIESHLKARIVIRDTDLSVPFDSKMDKFETLSKILVHDTARNKLIFNDITKELNVGKKAVIITERKDHIDSLNQHLKQFYQTITLSGDDSESSRNASWKTLHEGNFQALIIRFVLVPFSFVFLLAGNQQYHIVWETLDTEEATYIWHIEKNKSILKKKLQQIDHDLGVIRTKGRQVFLENMPENFSRIVNDYTDKQKGFIVWRDALEERLV